MNVVEDKRSGYGGEEKTAPGAVSAPSFLGKKKTERLCLPGWFNRGTRGGKKLTELGGGNTSGC